MIGRIFLLFCGILLGNWWGILPSASGNALEPVYLSPQSGAQQISTGTSIAVRTAEAFQPGALNADLFSVEGSKSGRHSGVLRLSDDNLTLLFYPDRKFAFGEKVQVKILPGLQTVSGKEMAGTSFSFSTIDRPYSQFPTLPDEMGQQSQPAALALAQSAPTYYTYPEFNTMMPYSVTVPANGTAPGLVFFTSSFTSSTYTPGLFIVDNSGTPIYMQSISSGLNATDFKVQSSAGVPYLTYHRGTPAGTWSNGIYYQLDQSYNLVTTWTIGNGYGADEHDMQLLDNGHALLLSYTPIVYDLSPFGGPKNGVLIDGIIQEQDAGKNVVFEWHASQHLPIANTNGLLSTSPSDYFHLNAIELDTDGNLLVSSRHLSQIIKINRSTGDVIWKLGGVDNQFTFAKDSDHFYYQHDIRRLPNQHITLFDNGNLRQPKPYSRAIEYAIDETAKTISSVWEYPTDSSIYAPYMGDTQRLPNGNTMIGWGALPQLTEVTTDGKVAFEITMSGQSYRAFRFAWNALPALPPRLVVLPSQNLTSATLYFAWNGATQIASYDIYAGATPDKVTRITNVPKSGFETSAVLTNLPANTCVFQVQPIRQGSTSLPFSNDAYQVARPECAALLTNRTYMPFAGQ